LREEQALKRRKKHPPGCVQCLIPDQTRETEMLLSMHRSPA
jgi:hypothetical protein